MPRQANEKAKRTSMPSGTVASLASWKLEDAKARFSEVVRRASTSGPQLVTIRGKDAAVVLAPEEYEQLRPKPKDHLPLVQFLRGLALNKIDLVRERDTGREQSL